MNLRYKVKQEVEKECELKEHGLSKPPSCKSWDRIPALAVGAEFLGQNCLLTCRKCTRLLLPLLVICGPIFDRLLVVTELHGSSMAGIHAASNSGAFSIVKSGGYSGDDESGWYMGEGGNDTLGTKRQMNDQTLTRGNAGLKLNVEAHKKRPGSKPIRVFIGLKQPKHEIWQGTKRCVYAGQHNVLEWEERKVDGFRAYFFKLEPVVRS